MASGGLPTDGEDLEPSLVTADPLMASGGDIGALCSTYLDEGYGEVVSASGTSSEHRESTASRKTFQKWPIHEWGGQECFDWASSVLQGHGINYPVPALWTLLEATGELVMQFSHQQFCEIFGEPCGSLLYLRLRGYEQQHFTAPSNRIPTDGFRTTCVANSARETFPPSSRHFPRYSSYQEEDVTSFPPFVEDPSPEEVLTYPSTSRGSVWEPPVEDLRNLQLREKVGGAAPPGLYAETTRPLPSEKLAPRPLVADAHALYPVQDPVPPTDPPSFHHDPVHRTARLGQDSGRRLRRSFKHPAQRSEGSAHRSVFKKIASTTRPTRERGPRTWEFLIRLLMDKDFNPKVIRWESEATSTFRLVDPEGIAELWSSRNPDATALTYKNFARSLRYHYNKGPLEPVSEKQLVYRCGPQALRFLGKLRQEKARAGISFGERRRQGEAVEGGSGTGGEEGKMENGGAEDVSDEGAEGGGKGRERKSLLETGKKSGGELRKWRKKQEDQSTRRGSEGGDGGRRIGRGSGTRRKETKKIQWKGR